MANGDDGKPPGILEGVGKGLVEDGLRTLKVTAIIAVIGAAIGAGAGFKLFGGDAVLIGAGVGAAGAVLIVGLLYVSIWD